jgi:hypothetical protein
LQYFDSKADEFKAGDPSAARSEELYNENKKKLQAEDTPSADTWGTKHYKSFGKHKKDDPPPSETGFSG